MTDSKKVLCVVDNGHAQQKCAYFDGGEIKLKISPSRAETGATSMGILNEGTNVYDIADSTFTVGEDVQNPISLRSAQYAYSEVNAVLVHNSLHAAGFSGQKVVLATGLPYAHYYLNGKPNLPLINKVKESLQVKVTPRNKTIPPIEIVEHHIFAESTAAFIDFGLDWETKQLMKISRGVCVIDMGGQTTDITVVDSSLSVDDKRSGSSNIGVLSIRDKLKQYISQKFDVSSLPDSVVDEALRTGVVTLWGQENDVTNEVVLAKRSQFDELIAFINEKIGDGAALDLILFVGGGANLLKDEMSKAKPYIKVPNNAEGANAGGLLKFLSVKTSDE